MTNGYPVSHRYTWPLAGSPRASTPCSPRSENSFEQRSRRRRTSPRGAPGAATGVRRGSRSWGGHSWRFGVDRDDGLHEALVEGGGVRKGKAAPPTSSMPYRAGPPRRPPAPASYDRAPPVRLGAGSVVGGGNPALPDGVKVPLELVGQRGALGVAASLALGRFAGRRQRDARRPASLVDAALQKTRIASGGGGSTPRERVRRAGITASASRAALDPIAASESGAGTDTEPTGESSTGAAAAAVGRRRAPRRVTW